MSGIETFGAKCPCCKEHSVWSKHESSNVALQFDACVQCGFIDWVSVHVRNDKEQTEIGRFALWGMLLNRLGCSSLAQVQEVTKSWGEDEPKLVFNYDSYSKDQLESKRVNEPQNTLSFEEINNANY